MHERFEKINLDECHQISFNRQINNDAYCVNALAGFFLKTKNIVNIVQDPKHFETKFCLKFQRGNYPQKFKTNHVNTSTRYESLSICFKGIFYFTDRVKKFEDKVAHVTLHDLAKPKS